MYWKMHIYLGHIYPLLQLTIDLWNTTTPNKFYILENAHIPRADVPPPPINHRSLEHHYTKSVSHIGKCTYILGKMYPLLQLTIYLCNTLHKISFTYWKMHIYLGQMYLPQINHRPLEHHYTKCISHIGKCIYT